MRAIAIGTTGKLEIVEDLPDPELRAGHVMLRTLAGGVCGSDLDAIDAQRGVPGGNRILGHEGGGVVVQVSPDVTTHRPGDIVVVEPNYACLVCDWCRAGHTRMCTQRTVVGRDVPGIFSELATVPARHAWVLPPLVSLEVLAAFEPSVVARSAVNGTLPRGSDNVLVIGGGSQGQAVIRALVQRGVVPHVSEPHPGRMARALEQGARGLGRDYSTFDVLYETSGVEAGFRLAIDAATPTGRICLLGQSASPFSIITRNVVQKGLTIQGSVIYDHPEDFQAAVDDFAADRFHPNVAMRVGVAPHQALRDLERARSLDGKLWIDFTDWSK